MHRIIILYSTLKNSELALIHWLEDLPEVYARFLQLDIFPFYICVLEYT